MWLTGRADGPPLYDGNGAAALAATFLDSIAATAPAADLPGVQVLGERAAIFGLARSGDVSPGGACRLLPTRDGYVALSLPRAEDLELVPALVGGEVHDVWDAVRTWAALLSSTEVVARARLLGLAVARLGEASSVTGPAVRLHPGSTRDTRSRPRVLDLSSLWAGPLCAHLLALTGADVVKVESTSRPDGTRRGPAAFFDLLHARSRGVTVDFASTSGRATLHDLVAGADVVISSSRPRALEALGLDPHAVASTGTTWVAITAHGLDNGADRIGFGDDVAVAAGLVGRDADGPVFAGDAIADPLTGLAAAASTAELLQSGRGGVLDVAMVRVAAAAAAAGVPGGADVPAVPPTARPAVGPGPLLGADNYLLMAQV